MRGIMNGEVRFHLLVSSLMFEIIIITRIVILYNLMRTRFISSRPSLTILTVFYLVIKYLFQGPPLC